jgi:MFS family permease
MDKRHSPLTRRVAVQRTLPASLREPGPFRLLFWGQALSVIGDRITPVAIAFAVLELGTATDLGVVMAAGGIPFALFALAGGVWADRIGRRRMMLASDILRALSQAATAALLLSGSAEVWMLAVLAFVYGVSAAVFMPALVGLIPQTVSAPRLQEANALLALTRSVANIAGPVVAGVIVTAAGSGEAIAVDAATFVVSALCLARLRPRDLVEDAGAAHAPPERFLAGLRAGWQEVRSRAWLSWGLVAMSAYHVFVLPAVFVLGPALSERELDGASSWATIVACFGIGSVIGNVAALRLPLPRPVFMAAVALVGASTQALIIGSGLGTAGIAALELLAGVCVALFFTLWDLSIQEQIPPRAVSRVSAYDFTVSMGLMPLGLAVCGPLADAIGLHATLRWMSAIGIASALLWLAQPSVRSLRRPEPAAPERPEAEPSSLPMWQPAGADGNGDALLVAGSGNGQRAATQTADATGPTLLDAKLRGLTLETATTRLRSAGGAVGKVKKSKPSRNGRSIDVASLSMAAAKGVAKGTRVTLRLARNAKRRVR